MRYAKVFIKTKAVYLPQVAQVQVPDWIRRRQLRFVF